MTATNHDDQLGEIYPTMLNELNWTFGVSFSGFHCRHRHGIGPFGIFNHYLVQSDVRNALPNVRNIRRK